MRDPGKAFRGFSALGFVQVRPMAKKETASTILFLCSTGQAGTAEGLGEVVAFSKQRSNPNDRNIGDKTRFR